MNDFIPLSFKLWTQQNQRPPSPAMLEAFCETGWQALTRGVTLSGDAARKVFLRAAESGHKDGAWGLALACDINLPNDVYAIEALCRASAGGHAAVVKFLLASTTDHNQRYMQKACRWAILGGHTETARVFAASPAFDVNVVGRNGDTLFQLAARLGHAGIVQAFLSRLRKDGGLDSRAPVPLLSLPDVEGQPSLAGELSKALGAARHYGHHAVISLLLREGAQDMPHRTANATTPSLPLDRPVATSPVRRLAAS